MEAYTACLPTPAETYTGPKGHQDVEIPRIFNQHTKVVRLSALRTGRL
jgi:hypothetical protein